MKYTAVDWNIQTALFKCITRDETNLKTRRNTISLHYRKLEPNSRLMAREARIVASRPLP